MRVAPSSTFAKPVEQNIQPTPKNDVPASLETVRAAGSGSQGVAALATELRANPDPAFQNELIRQLVQEQPDFALELLNFAGGENVRDANSRDVSNVSTEDRQLIANAFGSAFDSGSITGADLRRFLEKGYFGGVEITSPNMQWVSANVGLGALIGQSGSSSLKEAFAVEAINFAANPPRGFSAHSALTAALHAIANDPVALENTWRRLSNDQIGNGYYDITPETLLRYGLNRDPDDYYGRNGLVSEQPVNTLIGHTNSLAADVLLTARSIRDFDVKVDIFSEVANHPQLWNGVGVRDGMLMLYNSDALNITNRIAGPPDERESTITMSRFFQGALFGNSSPNVSSLYDTLNQLGATYRAGNSPTTLGRLAGTMMNGFKLAVEESQASREAVRNLAGIVFSFFPGEGLAEKVFDSILPVRVVESLAQYTGDGAADLIAPYLTSQGFLRTDLNLSWGQMDDFVRELFQVDTVPDPNPQSSFENEFYNDFRTGFFFSSNLYDSVMTEAS